MEVSVASASELATRQSPGAAPPTARRERKKQQLRDALIEAALELFEAKGYEHTAIREITDAVDVSERTFFRYFASKEDLALSFMQDRISVFVSALADRPADEAPVAAIRNAFHDSLSGMAAGRAGELPPYLSMIRLMDASPVLVAASLRYLHDHEDDIVGVLARREGVDPATDRRPRVLAAVFGAIVFLANQEWIEQGATGSEAMAAAFDAYADQLLPSVAGHWIR
ncbi:MAG TPA: TetR family transcriptional regulator [Streptosporangiaceae bacterium]